VAGIPDACTLPLQPTLSELERQRQVHEKIIAETQTVTKQYLIDYAAGLGWTITIEETNLSDQAFILGVVVMGVNPLGGVNSYANIKITITDGPADTTLLKCIFDRIKPAHVTIQWIE